MYLLAGGAFIFHGAARAVDKNESDRRRGKNLAVVATIRLNSG